MSRVIAIAACGLALAACSSSMPSFEMPQAAPATTTLKLESEPPGAEARIAQGAACRTPCELPVTVASSTSVTFTLAGFVPQTVAVDLIPPGDPRFGESVEPRLTPNPVFAELDPAPAATRRPPAKTPAKKKQAPRPTAASEAPPAMQQQAPAPSPFPPPPASAFPPPQR